MECVTLHQHSGANNGVDSFTQSKKTGREREFEGSRYFGFENVGVCDIAFRECGADAGNEVFDVIIVPSGADYSHADSGSVERREVDIGSVDGFEGGM